MGRRGRKRQLDLETEYWKLLQAGVGTVAACKLLSIGRKTGYQWRAENGGLPPARLAESSRSSRFLSLLERQRIATLRGRGLGGTNENTNGLLRQYFAKGSDLRAFSLDDLRTVEERLNDRPRKRLGWRSPAQAMADELAF